jgi:predicted ATP-grasp superfamily ATP-dependent carboligase
LREFPITGGPSVYRRSELPDPELAASSLKLLRAMNWEGVAMVEFRQDQKSKQAVLMEVNGRFWGSLPLAVHAGVNFPYLLYRSMGQGVAEYVSSYRIPTYCRQLSADSKWLLKVLGSSRRGHRILLPCGRLEAIGQYLLAFLRCRKYDIEWLDDLRPAFAFWKQRLPFQKRRPSLP